MKENRTIVETKRVNELFYTFEIRSKTGSYTERKVDKNLDSLISLANVYLQDPQWEVSEIEKVEVEQIKVA